jgi:hypothetical protein
MATFTRGYSFGTTEVVNAAKLHALVENAQLVMLSAGDFSGDVHGISVHTGPTSPVVGAAYMSFEPPLFDISSYSGVFSSIRFWLYDPGFDGYVAFVRPYGMETRRWVGSSDRTSYNPGSIAHPDNIDSRITLTLGDVGGAAGTAAQGIVGAVGRETIPGTGTFAGRVVFRGFTHARRIPAGQGTDTWPISVYLQGVGFDTAVWAASTHTSIDGIWGFRMDNIGAGGTSLLPTWLIGSPIYR